MSSLGLLSSFINETSVASPLQQQEMGTVERPTVQLGGSHRDCGRRCCSTMLWLCCGSAERWKRIWLAPARLMEFFEALQMNWIPHTG